MTNRTCTAARILIALALTASAFAQTDAQKAFATIKNMPGTWEGKAPDGHTFQVTFRVVSGGSAVESEIQVPNEDMISMFHLDGNRLLMTHYCAAQNQPRMQASVSADGKTMTFNYVDATNLASPDAGHMQKMVLTVLDDNHHTEEWTFVDHGKEHKETFDLRRKL
ncbi:MAG TPA: hypothetical protein VE377_27620 [Candidatus Dormibacteraeota bacterium]|nr:hypothetical protein [Candidatus Dormibacteraeota bacterium]